MCCRYGQCIACLFLLKSTRSPSSLSLSHCIIKDGQTLSAVSVDHAVYHVTTLSCRLGRGRQTQLHMQVGMAHFRALGCTVCRVVLLLLLLYTLTTTSPFHWKVSPCHIHRRIKLSSSLYFNLMHFLLRLCVTFSPLLFLWAT